MTPAQINFSGDHLSHTAAHAVPSERICSDELQACPCLNIRLVMGDSVEDILKLADNEPADLIICPAEVQAGLIHPPLNWVE